MNVIDLRAALDDLAGPLVAPTVEQRQSVRRRVRRARIVRGASALALAVVIAIGVGAIVSVNASDGDQPTPVVTDRGRTVHDEKVGYTVTIPRGWYLDTLQPDGTVVNGVRLAQYNAAKQARETNRQFHALARIQSERMRLEQNLNERPTTPDRGAILRRIDDLNVEEIEVRTRTSDLRPIEASRLQLQKQLNDPSLLASDRATIQNRIDLLNEAEVRIRTRQKNGCVAPEQAGIHLAVLERSGAARRRPTRFGPHSGTGLRQKRTSPGCRQLVQSMKFTDAGRTFALSVTMATDTGPIRRADTYAILNSLRFDPR